MTIDRWIALIGLLLGVTGCGLAIWFHRRSEKRRTPTFLVHPNRRLLAHPVLSQLSNISVLYEGQKVGDKGITEVQIHFWNSGNLPLLQSDILEPFVIRAPAKILSCAVTKLSRPVVRLQAIQISDSGGRELQLSFAVLEPGDGATLTVVYDGPFGAQIDFSGACVGAAKPTVLPSDETYLTTPSNRLFKTNEGLIMAILFMAIAGPVIASVFWVMKRLFGEHVLLIILVVLAAAFGVSLIGSMLWFQYKALTAKYVPPDIKPG